ncbi:hypothetical protein T4E_9790, partial [Trichinella pseudospiralis]
LWFILVEEGELPFLCFVQVITNAVMDRFIKKCFYRNLNLGVNQASEGKVPFTTMRERTSRAMGKASFQTHFNITVIICAPRFACFTATLEDEMKILNIKVDGVLSSTLEALGSIRKKNSGSMFQMVAVIVDKCLEMVLKTATVGSWPPVKVHVLFV